ncbi:HIG1 domain family member 2A [Atheta coriaria]|uniref:HIG1 domain family member 2A n=1 Tax=Dalotia coriaria TaxID=877792 RepID=UPI0031F474F9
MGKEQTETTPEFDWVSLHNELGKGMGDETTKERMVRKMKENPLVPIGCLATASALVYGLYCFRRGERRMSQYMMRTRIAAQGFTVVALIAGLGFTASKK